MSAVKGKIKPALPTWPMGIVHPEKWSFEKVCQVAKQLGMEAVEVVNPEDFPTLKAHGLVSALTTSHWFIKGPNNRMHWDECRAALMKSIDANAEYGFTNVITFWGYEDTTSDGGSKVSLEEGKKNLIEFYKSIAPYAEKKKVLILIEALNTRDAGDWMGHPGYQGSNVDDCMEVVRAVGSPAFRLLLDLYHVQIMNGDLIRRIGQYKDFIGYVQVAGVPGRHELDSTQEINFPAVLKALADNGYRGYLGLEFIPTKDPLDSLTEAVGFFNA